MSELFPITQHWSWGTFFLYAGVSYLAVFLCKKGAAANAGKTCSNHLVGRFNHYYVCAAMILTLLATIRSLEVGVDTHKYVSEFLNASEMQFDLKHLFSFHQMEPGYQLVLMLTRALTDNYHILFFVVYAPLSFAYILFISHFYSEKGSYVFLPLFIFYFVSNMSGMRAGMATIFLLYSFILIDQKKYIKAIIVTLVACAFHYTMLFNFYVILMTWLFAKPQVRKRRWLWTVGLLLSVALSGVALSGVQMLLAGTKYEYYLRTGGNQSFLGSIVFVIYGVIALLYYDRIIDKDTKYSQLLIMTLAFLAAYPMIYLTGAYRIPYYYILPRLVIWDYSARQVECKVDPKYRMMVRIGLCMIVFVYLLFRFTRASVDGAFAYKL